MIRRFDGDRPLFLLETENTSYAFRVLPTLHLEHLHYGPRLGAASAEELMSLTEKRSFSPGAVLAYDAQHPAVNLEDMCLELSTCGKGDVREPFIELVHADGGRTSDFLYAGAEITDTKPPYAVLPGSYDESGRVEHLTVRLRDEQYGEELELHYYVYPDCDVICRSARLRNLSSENLEVDRLLSMQLDLADSPWSVTCFHGSWVREMEKATLPLPAGRFVMESRMGCSSSRMNPFFMLHESAATEDSGECYGFNLLYSGNHYETVEVNAFGKTRVLSGIHPQGFRFTLGPGETFEAPEAVMTYSSRGFNGQIRNMHRFVREHIVRGEWKHKPRPVLLNSWEASYFNFTERSLVSLAKAGKELGIELFVMDDGWFGERSDDTSSLGDWDVNLKKLPGGLAGLGKKLKEMGLSFGVWVEPEMVNVRSKLFEAHPDWTMAIPGKPHSEGRTQRLLDLANPEVQDFIIEKMTEVFSSADISYVKWDFNRIFSDVYSPALPPEKQGETAHRYVLGLYRVMDKLTRRFPHILFEGCASGGNRFDLGVLSYFPQIWASDNTDAVSRVRIQEGYSYGYPLSTLGAHISACPNHQTLRSTPWDTRFNVAAFGVLGCELDLRDLSAEERKKLKSEIALYKNWREVFQYGDFYRGRSGNLHEWTSVSPDRRMAVGLLLQELTRANTQFERYFPKGLDGEKRYHFSNEEQRLNLKRFGSLVNTVVPFHVKQDSPVHNAIARAVTMPGETEDIKATGRTLMAGVKLKQAFSGTGYNEEVRYFVDFSSRLYFMLAEEE